MKSPIPGLLISLLIPLICAEATPPAGQYAGFLKLTKHVDGLAATATVRAVAKVGPSGGLTVVLATAQSPLPDATGLSTTLSDVLRTTIAADNSCVILGKPQPAKTTPPEALGDSSEFVRPIFIGTIRTTGNNFSLTYTDIAANYPSFAPVVDFTEFTYSFRRVSEIKAAGATQAAHRAK